MTKETMDFKQLRRPLRADEIDFRVGATHYYKNKAYATLVPYKDARVDMNILDEAMGPEYWQASYQRDSKEVLQCSIGIYNDKIQQWVWKSSNGVESNMEKEKGEYSDAFKRAGFMWGIGRELYDLPRITVQLQDGEYETYQSNGNVRIKVSGFFKPNYWDWTVTAEEITASDRNGQQRLSVKR